jgi:hypothetical protein
MIYVLAPLATLLVACFAGYVAWAVARHQIASTSRNNRMREFREKIAALLATHEAFSQRRQSVTIGPEAEREAEIRQTRREAYIALRLLLAERRTLFERSQGIDPFVCALNRFNQPDASDEDAESLVHWAEHELRQMGGLEDRFWDQLLGSVERRWLQLVDWCRRWSCRLKTPPR